MSRESVFRRLTKYRESALSNPKENSLTEAFAVVLDEVDGLAMDLCKSWLDPAEAQCMFGERCEDDVDNKSVLGRLRESDFQCRLDCETQVWIQSARVDLELRFTSERSPVVVIRVEVKHGHEPEGDQLRKYQSDGTAVVLLAPAPDLLKWADDQEQIPDAVAQRSWQATARKIRQFRMATSLTELEQWLIDEFLNLLKEEQLMAREAIGPQHLIAMANHAESKEALKQLLDLAIGKINDDDRWQYDGGEGAGYGKYAKYRPVDDAGQVQWATAWYEFKASTDSSVPGDGSEDLYFLAGISANGKAGSFGENDSAAERLENLQKDLFGFKLFSEGRCHRFMRVATPMSVIRGDTIEKQADALAEWVIKSFDLRAGYAIADSTD